MLSVTAVHLAAVMTRTLFLSGSGHLNPRQAPWVLTLCGAVVTSLNRKVRLGKQRKPIVAVLS